MMLFSRASWKSGSWHPESVDHIPLVVARENQGFRVEGVFGFAFAVIVTFVKSNTKGIHRKKQLELVTILLN